MLKIYPGNCKPVVSPVTVNCVAPHLHAQSFDSISTKPTTLRMTILGNTGSTTRLVYVTPAWTVSLPAIPAVVPTILPIPSVPIIEEEQEQEETIQTHLKN